MVARALVEKNIEQGARLLRALDEAGIPVDVAYWMLASEWSHWWLVLGTPRGDETGPDRVSLQIIHVLRSLEDVDFLLDKLGVVGLDDRWVRAIRQRLPGGLPGAGVTFGEAYDLGGFRAPDANLSVQDSYVYRLMPSRKHAANGTARKRRTPRTGAATQGRSRMTSDAPQTPSPTPG
jgi:hypothetical protein